MAFKQLSLALNGAAQVLTGGLASSVGDPPIKQLGLQGDSSNVNPFYLGDVNVNPVGLAYSVEYPATVASIPGGPVILDFPDKAVVRLSEIYVKGTSGQAVHGWIIY